MEKTKIKLKYVLGVWKLLPHYPTPEDITFEIQNYLEKDGRPEGEFSPQTFKSIWGSKWLETKHPAVLEKMIQSGEFELTGTESKPRYKLKRQSD
jgi:hypothetical protein